MEEINLKILDEIFEGRNIIIIEENGIAYFEIESVSKAIGYITVAKGREYVHKTRINKIIKACGITPLKINGYKFLTLQDLKKLISVSHTEKNEKFIRFLKENNFIEYDEVFNTTRKESLFLDSLEQVLKELNLSLNRQFVEATYRFDAYIPELDLIIEYDENCHANYDKNKEDIREKYILDNHRSILRLNDSCCINTNMGKTINKIMKLLRKDGFYTEVA